MELPNRPNTENDFNVEDKDDNLLYDFLVWGILPWAVIIPILYKLIITYIPNIH